jgi:hypothetical protein
MTRYRVFYEDKAAAEIKGFGAHLLLCACVADRMGSKTLWDVQRVLDGQPKKGDSKLLAACRLHAAREVDEVVFAVFDTDQLHNCLKIPWCAIDELRIALEAKVGSPKVRPFLLERNLETLVEASARCLEPPSKIPQKRHNERDMVLRKAATASRSVRDCITQTIPTFTALVDAVAHALMQRPS